MTAELASLASGFSCYTTSKDEAGFIYKEIYDDKCYDGTELPESPFIIDAGANIGLFSVYMKQKYPSATILAFEPAPETYDILRRNLELHNVSDVETYAYGLSLKATTTKFTYFPNLPGNSTLHPEEKVELRNAIAEHFGEEAANHNFAGAEEIDVNLQRLSHFLGSHDGLERIDLLKIDVEGAELDVLLGLDDIHWDMIRNVVLETSVNSGVKAEIEKLLRDKGFIVSSEGACWAPAQIFMIRARRDD
ncbi:FkbM family methyltransferase [Colletotrichum eremochloae]|uniref:Putative FkbM family methyltransferase n=1 Tax=Colletotrichum sublineola TaxID=1173701 RepID=A0A066XT73_COLSU|nr:FkbM family methyltransferase [Colletotrichum sublineola]KAK2018020.1 FkbM family methyltransferase [Colletotrichum eremochloae]KDN70899.1 putative FkbM family methyltransferase [Colletotrichum sublineola]